MDNMKNKENKIIKRYAELATQIQAKTNKKEYGTNSVSEEVIDRLMAYLRK